MASPARDSPAPVRLAADGARHALIEGSPLLQFGVFGEPEHAPVVAVPSGDDATSATDPSHLRQRAFRIDHVLQDLVGVDHVERAVIEAELRDVAHLEGDVALSPARGFDASLGQHAGRSVDPDDLALAHPARQTDGDRPRSAADVEDVRAGLEIREEVPGGILDRSPAMGSQDAVVMTMEVAM